MKIESFERCWKEIVLRLTPRRLYSWSAAGGARSFFEVTRVDADGITVLTSKGTRCVPRKDFETIFEIWEGYISRRVQRQSVRGLSVNSTYVISVLHWMEIQPRMGGAAS
jgi:hypothetical protein